MLGAAYSLAVGLSAFLLFLIQPMAAKALLPAFGGSYLVWGAAVVFFQTVLLFGYAYAHGAQAWLGVRRYGRVHLLLLLAPLLCVARDFTSFAMPAGGGALVAHVFAMLLATVGLPVVVLSTTSLVLQRWYAEDPRVPREEPYFLYAASNVGSLAALLGYPVLVEPFLSLTQQRWVWWCGYGVLVLLHALCRPARPQPGAGVAGQAGGAGEHIRPARYAAWFVASAAGCAVSLSVTNVLTFDVASIPFLWVLPLSVYLLTFVLVFKRRPWFPGWLTTLFYWVAPLVAVLHLMGALRLAPPPAMGLLLHLAVLFVAGMNCHGRVSVARPSDPRRLTGYYLTLAAGGLAGSFAVTWVAPLLSRSLVEYPVSLAAAAGAIALLPSRQKLGRADWASAAIGVVLVVISCVALPLGWVRVGLDPRLLLLASGAMLLLALRGAANRPWALALLLVSAAATTGWAERGASGGVRVMALRNFYGIYKVFDRDGQRFLQHGTTLHGRQYLDAARAPIPLSYYHRSAPAGRLLLSGLVSTERMGMVGLGAGAMACYAGSNQTFTVFELDPDNLRVARRCFAYLHQAKARGARLEFVFGDGRVALSRAAPGSFDVLIIDAFNSGSIPTHLMTVEAFGVYLRSLSPGGVLLLHISNRLLELEPEVAAIAGALGLHAAVARLDAGAAAADADPTEWMVVSADSRLVDRMASRLGWRPSPPPPDGRRPWSDRYCPLLRALARP